MKSSPYQNLLTKSLKGEVWKDIHDFEGYYQISNLGRVKSLDRVIPRPRLYQQFVKGRILKQKIVKDFNKLTGDAMISLQVTFILDGSSSYPEQEYSEIETSPKVELKEVEDILSDMAVDKNLIQQVALQISKDKDRWVAYKCQYGRSFLFGRRLYSPISIYNYPR